MATHVNSSVIENNRKVFGMMGSTLGTGIFQAETRSCNADYEQKKLAAIQGGNVELYISREIKRFRMVSHNVEKVEIGTDAQGAPYVGLHTDSDKKISLPVSADFTKIGEVSDSALKEAIHGNQNIFFSNARKLAQELNALNNNEVSRLEALRREIDAAITSLKNAIVENDKKANSYEEQLLKSTPTPDYTAAGSVVTIEVQNN